MMKCSGFSSRVPGALLAVTVPLFLGGMTAPLTAQDKQAPSFLNERELRALLTHSPLTLLAPDPTNRVADDARAARLGQQLFFDQRLSADGTVSCATCHQPELAFTDGLSRSKGLAEVTRNAPTLIDVARQRWFFWDGRADTLWSQALEPLEHPSEQGIDRLSAVRVVAGDSQLRNSYEEIFGSLPDLTDVSRFPAGRARPAADDADEAARTWRAMSEEARDEVNLALSNLGKAIAAYERLLLSGEAPFDRFVAHLRSGDASGGGAISESAIRGAQIFVGKGGCRQCHLGPSFSDGEFHSTGVPPLGGGTPHDAGRYEGLRKLAAREFPADGAFSDDRKGEAAQRRHDLIVNSESWGLFKTPSLRQLIYTAPFMHEGQYATLDAVVEHYSTLSDVVMPGHHQEQILRPLNLTDAEKLDLVEFLRSLSSPLPDPALLAPPSAPNSFP